ncbi:MAG: hypothetical protein IPF53_17920 [Blastocatellia bacterium]|nr:hypothetical protein [Blastocatellia bacterium]MBK6426777.1 hypothetical protein [Blastocatellia bacterium]
MTSQAKSSDRAQTIRLAIAALSWFVAYFVARVLLKDSEAATWVRVAVALMPVPFFVATLIFVVRGARDLDELQRRIQLEALAIAFLVTMVFLMTLGLLQRAISLPFEDWSYLHVWPYLPVFYFGGIVIASRRYR